jgi:hypothetical protein
MVMDEFACFLKEYNGTGMPMSDRIILYKKDVKKRQLSREDKQNEKEVISNLAGSYHGCFLIDRMRQQ